MSLFYVGQQISIYGGFFIMAMGFIGNGINIIVFSTFRNYRTTPSTFYFLITSIINLLGITVPLPLRILSAGFGIDLTRTSRSWCKIRYFLQGTLSVSILSCSCLATIDQFFVTSRNANFRRLSSIKWAHRIAAIVIIGWCLAAIPFLVLYDISPVTMTCICINADFNTYITVLLFLFTCVMPLSIMVIFGWLTYRNIHSTIGLARQKADRQLAIMTLIQVITHFICFVSYSIFAAYFYFFTAGFSKDINRLMIESFVNTIISLVPSFDYAVICYMFLISSSRFRQAARQRIFFCFPPNQVRAFQQHTGPTPVLSNKR